jgi:hypothetical protein
MTDILLPGKATLVEAVFKRTGSQVDILRGDGTAAKNKYGKIEDQDRTYTVVATEYGKRMYGSYGERNREEDVQGGRVSQENARVALSADTDAQVDDRVEFPDGRVYHLDAEVPRETHYEYKTTLVNE